MNPSALSSVLRAADLRGPVPEGLNPPLLRRLGRVLGAAVGGRTVLLAGDWRLSTPELMTALAAGLREGGARPLSVGQGPTPFLYHLVRCWRPVLALMVTASHNPPEDNGVKILAAGRPVAGAALARLADALTGALSPRELARIWGMEGWNEEVPDDAGPKRAREAYRALLREAAGDLKGLRIVLDGGHGAAGPWALRAFREAGADVVPLYCTPDGRFPAHPPNPARPEALEDVRRTVRAVRADLGVAFDGDGDRLGVVDAEGRTVRPEAILALFMAAAEAEDPGTRTVVVDVRASRLVEDQARRLGWRLLRERSGHSFLKARMRTEGARLGGEGSGHLYFSELNGDDDALYAALRLARLVRDRPLGTAVAELPRYWTLPEVRLRASEAVRARVLEEIAAAATRAGLEVTWPDGVRIAWPGAWALIRHSITEPVLSLTFEALSPEALREAVAFVRDRLPPELRGGLESPSGQTDFG